MKECITKQEEHFGFIPKQNFGFIEEINKKVEKLESLMKLMIDSHLEDFNVHEKNIKFLDEKLKNQEQLVRILLEEDKKRRLLIGHPEEVCMSLRDELSKSQQTTVNLPFYLTRIPEKAFAGTKIREVVIPSSVILIGDLAFVFCSSLKQITIPSSLISIGKGAFGFCTSLTHIIIPSSVKLIGDYAFINCESLIQITIPSSVEFVGDGIFANCSKLCEIKNDQEEKFNFIENKYLIFKSSLSGNYDTLIFAKCDIESANILPTIKFIRRSAFYCCKLLKQITIPSYVTSIGDNAFYNCESLTQIMIPSSVKSIGWYVISGCKSLTQITVPSFLDVRRILLGIKDDFKINIIRSS